MPKEEKIVKRSDKIAFMDVGTEELADFQRMRKFTEIATSKNAKEYNRQYVDEEGEDNDVVGYAEEKSYAFDQYTGNPVHEKIVSITEDELTGDDATVKVLVIDKTKTVEGKGFEARLRNYAVIPDGDGDSTDAYTYSGSLKAKGVFEKVIATISEDGRKATIVPDAAPASYSISRNKTQSAE